MLKLIPFILGSSLFITSIVFFILGVFSAIPESVMKFHTYGIDTVYICIGLQNKTIDIVENQLLHTRAILEREKKTVMDLRKEFF